MPPRILIVEDNESFAAAVEGLLRSKGLLIERAGDGITALNRVLAAPPDVLLLDLHLPGLHGVELLRKLRATPRTAQLPVIVMSGVYKEDRHLQVVRALGVTTCLEKPFTAAALFDALRTALSKPSIPLPAAAPPPPPAFDRLLIRAYLQRFSGQMTLHSPAGSHALTWINGAPTALRPGFQYRDFGDYLHRHGVISAEEYAYYAGPGAYRHELFVQMGCLGYGELLERKLAYLGEELVEAFRRPLQGVEETPATVPPGAQLFTVNMPQLVYGGYHTLLTPERSRRYLDQIGARFVALAPAYYEQVNFLTLNVDERYLLLRLDGTRTVRDCVAETVALAPLLCTLQALGMIRFAAAPLTVAPAPAYPLRALFNAVEESELFIPEETLESFADLVEEPAGESAILPLAAPAPDAAATSLGAQVRATHARLQGKDYYEALGLTQGNFSFDKLKEGYFAVTRAFGPDVLMQLGGEEAALAEEILSIVTTAYNTLSDVVKKENYDQLLNADRVGLGHKGDDTFQAQVQSQSGKVFIDMEEWDNAEKSLQDACSIEPENGDYLAHLAWAIYRNPKYANSRATLDKARAMLNRALTMERTPAGFAFKGWLLLDSGQEMLAEAEFNKALKLDARNQLARKGMRLIQEKREQQKKGLFGRMFGG